MNKITNCLLNKNNSCFPVWFMRQAGRYLPEFRKIRQANPDFVKLCLNSELSSEITLQPIKRFELDAAIIFSDILLVPYALGQDLKFINNEGPILSNFALKDFLKAKKGDFNNKLQPVYDAISKTRNKLNKKKSLIAFVGAPWTLLVYMLNLKLSDKTVNLEKFNKNKSENLVILDKLNDFLCTHIQNQFDGGADLVQIFDSWAGLIPSSYLKEYCYEPNKKLVNFCKKNKFPVICFPKGLNNKYVDFLDYVKPDGLSIDYDVDPLWARDNLKNVCLQGGLDPKLLLGDEKKLFYEVDKYLKIFKKTPYIFNLGHGLLPDTNPDVLNNIIKKVHSYK